MSSGAEAEVEAEMTRSADPISQLGSVLWLQEVARSSGNKTPFRRFYCLSTDTGYFGFGGYPVAEGDYICLLRGARVPIILRKAETEMTPKGKGGAETEGSHHYYLVADACKYDLLDTVLCLCQPCSVVQWAFIYLVFAISCLNH